MRIQHITFQGGQDTDSRPFSEIYREQFAPIGMSEGNHELVSRMVKMLDHLEQEVEAPPQWANTSHFNVVLQPRDYKEWGEKDDDEELGVIIISSNWNGSYTISYHLPQTMHLWHSLSGSTDDIKVAGQMIVEILKKAPDLMRLLRE